MMRSFLHGDVSLVYKGEPKCKILDKNSDPYILFKANFIILEQATTDMKDSYHEILL